MENCPVCKHPPRRSQFGLGSRRIWVIDCEYCGEFLISPGAVSIVTQATFDEKRHLLGGVLRNAFENREQLEILPANIEALIARAPARLSVSRVLDEMLLGIYRSTVEGTSLGNAITVDPKIYPLYYLKSEMDIRRLVGMLVETGWVESRGIGADGSLLQLAQYGFDRAEKLQSFQGRSDQAFVAMSFHKSLDHIFNDAIKPALESTGYTPIRVDRIEHNDKIDDVILSEIRRSGLVIADFSLHRQGVYFEAGFALGLGIPVIWTCRREDMENAHFDTRQYNHIDWADVPELRERLDRRIRASGYARETGALRE